VELPLTLRGVHRVPWVKPFFASPAWTLQGAGASNLYAAFQAAGVL
jgi:hypothetical protein